MKTKQKFILKTMVATLMVFVFTTNLYAVKPGNGNGNVDGPITGTNGIPGNNGNDKPVGNAGPNTKNDSVPLDGGLSILLAGAAIFGVKKLREIKK